MLRFLRKLFRIRKRQEIRRGKLWEFIRFLGIDLYKVRIHVAQPRELVKPDAVKIDKMRTHVIAPPDNTTNLTKKPELL